MTVLGLAIGCNASGRDVPPKVQAELPTGYGVLWDLCPPPEDDPILRQNARDARRATRALIREVRRHPDDVLTAAWRDHDGNMHYEQTTVRELAQNHLENPGAKGVPCESDLMAELQAAVDGA